MNTIALPLSPAARPRTLSQPLAYALSAAIIGLALFASATPSPLYATYSRLWGFSSVVLTLVYATYAIGVLVALLLAGRASDMAGRRPVLLIALGALIAASVFTSSPPRSCGCSRPGRSRASRPGWRSAPRARGCSTSIPAVTPIGRGSRTGA